MEQIRIPNRATYSPVALTDLFVAAPLASRLVVGATLPGRLVQAAALGAYVGSAAADWARRLGARRIDFLETFGADVRHLEATPREAREREVERLATELAGSWHAPERQRPALARRVDEHLTAYIAGITGQRIRTSTEVRSFTLAGFLFPFAAGACDFLSGDVAIFRPLGVFEPHVIAHEFAHRKGYWKELEAQALAYLALVDSADPVLSTSARCELLHRQLSVLARGDVEAADRPSDPRRADTRHPGSRRSGSRRSGSRHPGSRRPGSRRPGSRPFVPRRREVRAYRDRLEALELPGPLEEAFRARSPTPPPGRAALEAALRRLYEERLRLTGQNGLSDYDEGFTDFLYTAGRRSGPPAGQGEAGSTPTTR